MPRPLNTLANEVYDPLNNIFFLPVKPSVCGL